jgi:hypothetical protein
MHGRFGEEPEAKAADDIDLESIIGVIKEGRDIFLRASKKERSRDQ